MGVSINWLKKYVDIDWEAELLAHKLTMAGVAIEGIEKDGEDSILELDLTPNRGDCLGMINLAREVSALNGNEIRIPETSIKENGEDINDYLSIDIDSPELCPRYAARLIKNVKIESSPQWMQEALMRSGVRPINNIVDVTNYVMLESNQPLHAFDYDLLGAEKQIVVRTAMDGEKFTTLDEVERTLDDEMLMITDGERAIALAGVMGGLNTEINDNTVNILLESANFLAANIRKTSRKLGLRSDASVRFEKGADIDGVIYAVNRASSLIQDLTGAEVVSGICDAYPQPQKLRRIQVRPGRVNYLLGTDLSAAEIRKHLAQLKFNIEENEGGFLLDIPNYRPDIEIEADLIEEVARYYGYDNIPAALPCGDTSRGGLDTYQKFRNLLTNNMARTLNEVINYSFINPQFLDMLLLPEDSQIRKVVKVANPLSQEQGVMRTILLPGLLENISRNLARKNKNLAFFELGSVFCPRDEGLPEERLKLGAVVCGSSEENWLKKKMDMDFFFLKGILEKMLKELEIQDCRFQAGQNAPFHPGRTALLLCDGIEIGILGEIHPLVLQNFDIKERTCAFELDVESLFKLAGSKNMKKEIAKYPAVERDIAILLEEGISSAQALSVIEETETDLLQDIIVFDIYSGKQVPAGYKSIAFRLILQSRGRTLTENDVNTVVQEILERLENKLGASLR